jgi:tetratricopeptide (TPR) repeat protein
MRLGGQSTRAESVYDKALAVLDQAHAADPKHSDLLNELAMVTDARGWIYLELGDVKKAEQAYRSALKLLEDLVKEFPTVSRHRESLARVYNSLAIIEESDGRLADAETHLQSELPLVERLSQDFPNRPEHQRELARTLTNLGNVLSAQNRPAAAEPILRRAIKVNTEITAKNPDDVQFRLDLAKDHNNLGELLRKNGDPNQAVTSFLQARSINEALVKAFPDKPRYRYALAGNLFNLALALRVIDPAKVEEACRASLAIYEKLVADYPQNIEYRLGFVLALDSQATVLAGLGKSEQAEAVYKKALAKLETRDDKAQLPEWLRAQATILNNLGELDRPGAEEAYCRSISLSQSLIDRKPPLITDRRNLAMTQTNLGQLLVDQKRLTEAGSLFAQSVANLEQLVAETPMSIELQSLLGSVLTFQGKWLAQSNDLVEAKTVLTSAVEHQRKALQLSKNAAAYRAFLGGHLVELAEVNLKLDAYEEAARIALDLPKTVPSANRAKACFNAAQVLARLISRAGADAKLAHDDRDRLSRKFLGRAIVLLREANDASPELAEQIKTDSDIKLLESRPEFQTIMNTLVKLEK